jgi:hypothetical protein
MEIRTLKDLIFYDKISVDKIIFNHLKLTNDFINLLKKKKTAKNKVICLFWGGIFTARILKLLFLGNQEKNLENFQLVGHDIESH